MLTSPVGHLPISWPFYKLKPLSFRISQEPLSIPGYRYPSCFPERNALTVVELGLCFLISHKVPYSITSKSYNLGHNSLKHPAHPFNVDQIDAFWR